MSSFPARVSRDPLRRRRAGERAGRRVRGRSGSGPARRAAAALVVVAFVVAAWAIASGMAPRQAAVVAYGTGRARGATPEASTARALEALVAGIPSAAAEVPQSVPAVHEEAQGAVPGSAKDDRGGEPAPEISGAPGTDVAAALADLEASAGGPEFAEAEARAGRFLVAGLQRDPAGVARVWTSVRDPRAPAALRRVLIRAIAEGGTPADRAEAARWAGSPGHPTVARVAVFEALEAVTSTPPCPSLPAEIGAILSDPAADVRAAACRLLVRWSPADPLARSWVEATAASADPDLRALARGALGR